VLWASNLRFNPLSKQTLEAEACSYLNWKGSSLLWEINDCPRRYSFQRLEDFAYGFTQPGLARVAEKQMAPMLEDAPGFARNGGMIIEPNQRANRRRYQFPHARRDKFFEVGLGHAYGVVQESRGP